MNFSCSNCFEISHFVEGFGFRIYLSLNNCRQIIQKLEFGGTHPSCCCCMVHIIGLSRPSHSCTNLFDIGQSATGRTSSPCSSNCFNHLISSFYFDLERLSNLKNSSFSLMFWVLTTWKTDHYRKPHFHNFVFSFCDL